MNYAGVGLALVSLALFLAALVFSTRPGRTEPAVKEKKVRVSEKPGAANGQKAVIVELPGVDNMPDECIIDLKVLIGKNHKAELKKGGQAETHGKKINRLDKYL